MEAQRSALLIATSRYSDPELQSLRAPAADARAFARVLADPMIGGFAVRPTLLNEPTHRLKEQIDDFFADRGRDDLLLLYLSCHGVLDASGRLYFAAANTRRKRLPGTAVPASFVNDCMADCRSRRIVVLLDCCHSGAFARGMVAKADQHVALERRFEGRGRVVITASNDLEYAFEDDQLVSTKEHHSIFTRAVIEGLETGDADLDGDQRISVDDLYEYVFERVADVTPHQTPSKWTFDVRGELFIARSRRPAPAPQTAAPTAAAPAATPSVRRRGRGVLVAMAVVLAVAAAAFALLRDDPTVPTTTAANMRVMLDFYPNADHAPLYYALDGDLYKDRRLNVALKTPPDPAAPLKVLAAGGVDLALAYEPEVLIARDAGLDVVSVGALVQKPLTSLMALGDADIRRVRDLVDKRVGTTGIPYHQAYLRTILRTQGVDPKRVKTTNVGFNLVQPMLSRRVDATLGAFWNYEAVDLEHRGKKPVVMRLDKLGVPDYDEMVFVVRRRDLARLGPAIQRFLTATGKAVGLLKRTPALGVDTLMQHEKGLERGLQLAVVKATLPVWMPEDRTQPFGWQDPSAWREYAAWMYDNKLLKRRPDASRAFTNDYLPGRRLAVAES